MQRNVSPLTAIIVVLLALGIAALAWIRLSTGPEPTVQDRGRRQRSAGSQRRSTSTTERRSSRSGSRRGSRRSGGQRGGRQGGASTDEAEPAAEEHQSEAPAAATTK